MNNLAPFLWFNDNAEEAAEFYLRVFPHAVAIGPQDALDERVGLLATVEPRAHLSEMSIRPIDEKGVTNPEGAWIASGLPVIQPLPKNASSLRLVDRR